ncbi:EAL domain-containing protein [Enterobacter asburiae]|nr:EAL domain-containing protein [Enterobacter asburiae]
MIILNGVALSFRLEPVVNLFSQHIMGYEILSRPAGEAPDTERFFLSLPAEMLERVFYAQLRFFTAQCQADPLLVRNLFINLPPVLLLRERFMLSLTGYLPVTALNLEIQYDPGARNQAIPDFLKAPLPAGVRIWIDDVDGTAGSRFHSPAGPGIKLDKNTFWSLYRSRASLSGFARIGPGRLIVEGVETADHVGYLRENAVSFGQGYYWPATRY